MKSVLGLLLPLLAAGSPVLVDSINSHAAPLLSSTSGKHIEDSYMVVFKKHVSEAHASNHHDWVKDIHVANQNPRTELRKRDAFGFSRSLFEGLKYTYNMPGMLGYSGHFHEDVIEQIRNHPDVAFIERDSEVHTQQSAEPAVENNAPWGLARISHRDRLSFSTFNKYLYAAEGGEGVDAYIVDTGTNLEHVEFEGRATWGDNFIAGEADEDLNGHGTHCSGTVAGKQFGVAKKANIIAVKVLNAGGSGTMSGVVKGVEWAVTQHQNSVKEAKAGKKKGFKGSVANMSLGGGKSPALDLAVNAAVDAGLHFAVAAGNDNGDACNSSPSGAENPVTVCASTLADQRAYFSNYGTCTDIFAPGLNIKSAWIGSKYATNIISGTSMASPHVCGLLAYYLSLAPSSDSSYAVADLSPKKLKNALIAVATRDAITDVPAGTPNLLAWNGAGKSSFTEIFEEGGYTAAAHSSASKDFIRNKTKALKAELREIANELEELIERA